MLDILMRKFKASAILVTLIIQNVGQSSSASGGTFQKDMEENRVYTHPPNIHHLFIKKLNSTILFYCKLGVVTLNASEI